MPLFTRLSARGDQRFRQMMVAGLSALLAAFLMVSQSHAAEKLPRYHVEIIVFETLALKGWTEEYWPRKTAEDILPNWPKLRSMPTPLNPKVHRLDEEAQKMTREKGYNKLFHQAWVITGEPEDQSEPFKIEVLPGNAYQSRLFGKITFYKSRYAHVRLNLGLERRIPSRVREAFAEQQQTELELLPDYWHFQLKEARKIKSGELHYFDHPIFGALVQIQYLGE
ncbi:CsiV family protein [Hydrogenovibrio halophilus]|uniref:CsiV family protein n=1 Tax=Hydrogenovibrio halophilus TaxID=373391 RepID=UPI00036A9F29|nr:CsiV family protein [Hydrogenovibrio halophilus]